MVSKVIFILCLLYAANAFAACPAGIPSSNCNGYSNFLNNTSPANLPPSFTDRMAVTQGGVTNYVSAPYIINGPTVSNTIALRSACTSSSSCPSGDYSYPNGVWRLTDGVAGAPPLYFSADVNNICTSDDIGHCVTAANGGFWLAQYSGPADVREWEVDTSGLSDSTSNFQAAINSGLSLYVPIGKVQASSLTITGSQSITCAGPRSTLLQQNNTSGNFITITSTARYAGLQGCGFQPTVRVTGNQVVFQNGCYRCFLNDFEMSYVYDGILDQASGVQIGSWYGGWSTFGSIYGTYSITFEGLSSSARASNIAVAHVLTNNAPQVHSLNPSDVVTWTPNTSYIAGNATRVNGAIYQEQTSTCTSAPSGSGPTGFPSGTSPLNIFSSTIPDGTCNWYFVSNSLIGFVNNSWGDSAVLRDWVVLNNFESIKLLDNNNPGTLSAPNFPKFFNPTADHTWSTGFDLEAGFDVEIYSPYSGSSTTSDGIVFGGSYEGLGQIHGGRVTDNAQHGIVLASGIGPEYIIDGVSAESNSQSSIGTFHNISVASGIINFSITNSHVGQDPQAGITAGHGIIVNAGSSNYYIITGNICAAGTTLSCISDGGTGSNKTVSGNW